MERCCPQQCSATGSMIWAFILSLSNCQALQCPEDSIRVPRLSELHCLWHSNHTGLCSALETRLLEYGPTQHGADAHWGHCFLHLWAMFRSSELAGEWPWSELVFLLINKAPWCQGL